VSARASATVGRTREEVERRWRSSEYHREYIPGSGADVTFVEAPGDRGTEVHVDLPRAKSGGTLAGLAMKLTSRASAPRAGICRGYPSVVPAVRSGPRSSASSASEAVAGSEPLRPDRYSGPE
jgi:hypothetical protein